MINQEDKDDYYSMLRELFDGCTSEHMAREFIAAGLRNPNSNIPTIAAQIRDSKNPNRPNFFKTSDLIFVSNYTDHASYTYFVCEKTGFLLPQRDPNSKVNLAKSKGDLIARQKQLSSELEVITFRLSQMAQEESVEPTETVLFSQKAKG